jgi:predicted amidohydrolase
MRCCVAAEAAEESDPVKSFRMAAVQAAPVLFDKTASTEKACALIGEAARGGAELIAFGETWLPGYPFWVEGAVQDLTWRASADHIENAVIIGGMETDALCAAAREAGAYVICAAGLRRASDSPGRLKPLGVWEHTGQSTIIDPRGEIIAGPIEGEGVLYADGSLEVVRAAKAACDIAGHYARPDIFRFEVDDRLRPPARFASAER